MAGAPSDKAEPSIGPLFRRAVTAPASIPAAPPAPKPSPFSSLGLHSFSGPQDTVRSMVLQEIAEQRRLQEERDRAAAPSHKTPAEIAAEVRALSLGHRCRRAPRPRMCLSSARTRTQSANIKPSFVQGMSGRFGGAVAFSRAPSSGSSAPVPAAAPAEPVKFVMPPTPMEEWTVAEVGGWISSLSFLFAPIAASAVAKGISGAKLLAMSEEAMRDLECSAADARFVYLKAQATRRTHRPVPKVEDLSDTEIGATRNRQVQAAAAVVMAAHTRC